MHMQHVIVGLLLFQLLCLCNMQRRRSKNIIIMLVNSVKAEFTIFPKINHLHVQVLFKRTICTNSKNIQIVDKNSWQLPKIRPHRFSGEGVLIGGQNSNTKCSMTFVNIAVAISALAGGGGGQKRFRTETIIRWCFRHFSRIFGCLSARGY